MTDFDKYVSSLEGKRAERVQRETNAILQKMLFHRTHEQTLQALFAALGQESYESVGIAQV